LSHKNIKVFVSLPYYNEDLSEDEWKEFDFPKFFIPHVEVIQAEFGKCILAVNLLQQDYQNRNYPISTLEGIFDKEVIVKNKIPKLSKKIKHSPDHPKWFKIFSSLQNEIKKENLQKVVLARKTLCDFEATIIGEDVFEKLLQGQEYGYSYFFAHNSQACFFGNSPELFFRRDGRQIISSSIAGTIHYDESNISNLNEFFHSTKENNEHNFVTKFIKEKFIELCEAGVEVSQKEILSFKKLKHLYQKISGILKHGIDDNSIIENLHPTPALGGSPIDKAIEFQRNNEGFDRGIYGGLVGYISIEKTELAVAIRCALAIKNKMFLYAGGGVVARSKAINEWQEINYKIDAYLRLFK